MVFTLSRYQLIQTKRKLKNKREYLMKVLINKNMLESIVTNTNPYLEKRDLSAITSHIYISAKMEF